MSNSIRKSKDKSIRSGSSQSVLLGTFVFFIVFILICKTDAYSQSMGEKLFKAVTDKDFELVQKLVEKKNADVNYVRRINDAFFIPVLMQAVMQNSTDISDYLIAKGANVNARDGFKMTSLMWAAHNGNIMLVNLLLEKGADPKAEDDNGLNALKGAKEKGHEEIVNFLESKY